LESATASAIEACTWSPAFTRSELIATCGARMTSHHAEYDGVPFFDTSCSVPAWMSVWSPTRQPASTHPPPIPIHVAEYSCCPFTCCFAVGTVQSPLIALNNVPFSSAPWLYPDQLPDWLASIATIGGCHVAVAAVPGAATAVAAMAG